jgi:hypothetical protein
MQPRPTRPTGVTALAILAFLVGIIGLVAGVGLIIVGIALGTLATAADISNAITNAGYPGLASLSVGVLSALVIALGLVALVIGILYFAVGIGFFGGRGWSWTLGIIVGIIGLIRAIFDIAVGSVTSILSLVISGLILYYLTRPRVKAFFGKVPWGSPSTGGPSMMSASTMGATAPPAAMGTNITVKCLRAAT